MQMSSIYGETGANTARLNGTQSAAHILRREVDGMLVVCFHCGFEKINLSDQL